MTFDEACNSIGYDRFLNLANAPKILYTYFAYKNGECKTFSTKEEAQKFSKMVEVVKDKTAHDAYWEKIRELESKAVDVWYNDLVYQYVNSDVTQELFNICYSEAYNRYHSDGYDAVANGMDDLIEFAKKINSICK